MVSQPLPDDFYWPSPTIWIVFLAVVVSGLLVYLIGYTLGFDIDSIILIPALSVSAALTYLGLVWLMYRRDPRLWLDATEFRAIIQKAYPNWSDSDDQEPQVDKLRALAWLNGTTTLAQQAGLAAAGIAAAQAMSQGRWILALILFLGIFKFATWIIHRLLAARDRDMMESILGNG